MRLKHGEAWFKKKSRISKMLEDGMRYDDAIERANITVPQRMGRRDTIKYYNKKLRAYFKNI